jgi:hypothetical protein
MTDVILPRALYTNQGVKKILYHNDSCILYKKLTESVLDQENISISHCVVFVAKGKVEVKTSEGEYVASYENEMLFMPRDTYLISDLFEDCAQQQIPCRCNTRQTGQRQPNTIAR